MGILAYNLINTSSLDKGIMTTYLHLHNYYQLLHCRGSVNPITNNQIILLQVQLQYFSCFSHSVCSDTCLSSSQTSWKNTLQ